jgi:predicted DCC family thiol-disulfide oxidoreductase YuxK
MNMPTKLMVFVDGSCHFCQAVQARITPWDRNGQLDFVDYHIQEIAALSPFPADRLDAEMHVLTPDGSWHIGFDGWAAVLSALPAWRWLGWIFNLAPVRWIGRPVYRYVAKHRYSLPGMPRPYGTEGCSLPPRLPPKPPAMLSRQTR